jgi:ACS family hexuronate transporter-like MFS transporter
MTTPDRAPIPGLRVLRPIHRLRWWIGGLLFASTVINYIDRQTLSALAPFLKEEYRWTNEDYALIVIAFRVAYSIGQTVLGRVMDRVGTRLGLTITVTCYSVVAMLTSLAVGLRSFIGFRFSLGSVNPPTGRPPPRRSPNGSPRNERGWAVALFDSGSSIGAAIAPALVIWLYHQFGGWRPAFLITGMLGFLWLIAWRLLYHPPEVHPRLGEDERRLILADRVEEKLTDPASPPPRLSALLRLPQTWGTIIARAFTDPVWFFIADWFMIFLVSKGFKPESTLIAFWIPFIAADLGNFSGGGFSSWLISRGWPVGRARKVVVVFGGSACSPSSPRSTCPACLPSPVALPSPRFPTPATPPSPSCCRWTSTNRAPSPPSAASAAPRPVSSPSAPPTSSGGSPIATRSLRSSSPRVSFH